MKLLSAAFINILKYGALLAQLAFLSILNSSEILLLFFALSFLLIIEVGGLGVFCVLELDTRYLSACAPSALEFCSTTLPKTSQFNWACRLALRVGNKLLTLNIDTSKPLAMARGAPGALP